MSMQESAEMNYTYLCQIKRLSLPGADLWLTLCLKATFRQELLTNIPLLCLARFKK